jgi:hypothetical protein
VALALSVVTLSQRHPAQAEMALPHPSMALPLHAQAAVVAAAEMSTLPVVAVVEALVHGPEAQPLALQTLAAAAAVALSL